MPTPNNLPPHPRRPGKVIDGFVRPRRGTGTSAAPPTPGGQLQATAESRIPGVAPERAAGLQPVPKPAPTFDPRRNRFKSEQKRADQATIQAPTSRRHSARSQSLQQTARRPTAQPTGRGFSSPTTPAIVPQPIQKPKKRLRERFQVPQWLQYSGVIVLGLAAGFAMQMPVVGYVVLAVYALIALAFAVRSSLTFLLSLMSLATVVFLLTIRHDQAMATQFATYTFWLWVLGAISIGLEHRRTAKTRKGLRISSE